MLLKATILLAFGRVPAGEMVWPRKSASVAPIFSFDGENLRLCCRSCLKISLVLTT